MKSIRRFGAPNGLCSSITESKHIQAIKDAWRRTNHFQALLQILEINTRVDLLLSSRADFLARGMLDGSPENTVDGQLECDGGCAIRC